MTDSRASGRLPVVVLVSGRGTNLQALLDGARDGTLPAALHAVVSNVPGAPALDRAREAGVETRTLDHRGFDSRAAFDAALGDLVEGYAPGLVVLAGFMRVLGPAFVERFAGRLVNIHPSLLPDFRGLGTHRRAIEAGVREHGASVHFVTAELDGGPLIVRARVPVLPDDTPDALAARVLEQEHRILPLTVRWFAEGRLELRDGEAWLDGRPALEAAAG